MGSRPLQEWRELFGGTLHCMHCGASEHDYTITIRVDADQPSLLAFPTCQTCYERRATATA